MIWKTSNHKIYVDRDDQQGFIEFSENFFVSEVNKDLMTGEEKVTIILEHSISGDIRFTLPREQIDSKIISRMTKYGLTCIDNKDSNEIAACILMETEKSATLVLTHDVLGFVQDHSGESLFLLHNPVNASTEVKMGSTYVDPQKTAPHGQLSNWKEDVTEVILGHPNLELALAIGVLAPIAHLLLEQEIIEGVPLIALVGGSTTGKTTSLTLMSSIWYSKNMISDFNCTQSAFFEQMAQARGLPMLIDEASAVPTWDFTSTIYNLPKGKSKLRCKPSGGIMQPTTFSGAVIFTGESSLLNQTLKTRGLDARLLELNLPWTDSKEHAMAIHKLCRNNHGVAGKPIIEWLLNNENELKNLFNDYLDELTTEANEMGLDDVRKRLLAFISMLMIAGYAIKCSLELDINVDSIKETLMSVLKEKHEQYSNSDDAYLDLLKSKLNSGPYKIADSNDNEALTQGAVGLKGVDNGRTVLWLEKYFFEEFVNKNLPVDIDYVKKHFSKKGWLAKTSDRRYIIRKTFGGIKFKCYGLYVDASTDCTLPKTDKKNKGKGKNQGKKIPPQRKSLLED